MLTIITDTREKSPLDFSAYSQIETRTETLSVGDYSCLHSDGSKDNSIIERKSVSDLWTSYTSGYDRERDKILRAKEAGLDFILAIEDSAWNVRRGYEFYSGGESHRSRKDGLTMIRQLMTISRKYSIQVWFCESRKDMTFRIVEWFLAYERILERIKKDELLQSKVS